MMIGRRSKAPTFLVFLGSSVFLLHPFCSCSASSFPLFSFSLFFSFFFFPIYFSYVLIINFRRGFLEIYKLLYGFIYKFAQ